MEQLLLHGLGPRVGWTNESARGEDGKMRGNHVQWRHSSGWLVHHCGHPTANWPFEVTAPDGEPVVANHGHNFQTVRKARAAVEGVLAGTHRLVRPKRGPVRIYPPLDPQLQQRLDELPQRIAEVQAEIERMDIAIACTKVDHAEAKATGKLSPLGWDSCRLWRELQAERRQRKSLREDLAALEDEQKWLRNKAGFGLNL